MLIFKKTKQVKRFTGLHRTLDNHIEISKNFRIHGHEGTVSFITALTEQLYAACNTLRLLSNADYKVCVVGPFAVKFLSSFIHTRLRLYLCSVVPPPSIWLPVYRFWLCYFKIYITVR
ncbi:unnamed protein product [Cuscuta epithymum]|uniref:Uncharacterized protein n=1 Tax=Cuscuta epithymum TaxID=186058 RepID=A0AAV0CD58_9ASTE|nr:unnamed protein product [Cuscuta epithymum]